MSKRSGRNVLITGASGQDAHYVSELCTKRGDYVVGVSRRIREDAHYKFFHRVTHWADLYATMCEVQPNEVYHLAASHRSSEQREDDERGMFLDNLGMVERLLTTVTERAPWARVLLAGSCRMYGSTAEQRRYLNEHEPMEPDDGYGIAKKVMLQLGQAHRQAGFNVCTAILFNHESPRRSADYVTQKIARAAARKEKVELYDLQARVDWGHAADYARAMTMMLVPKALDDYVVSNGETHAVQDFARIAYEHVGLEWRDYVTESRKDCSKRVYCGDNTRISRELGWKPEISYEQLVREMVDAAFTV